MFEVLESEEAGMEAVRLETADDTELVCCDIVEEDSREKVDVEDEEEANKAFSLSVPPQILPINAKIRKHPKILPAILNVPTEVGRFIVNFFFIFFPLFQAFDGNRRNGLL